MDRALRETDAREEIGRLMAEYGDGILRQCLLMLGDLSQAEDAALMVYHSLDLDMVSCWEQVERPDGSGWENRRLETPEKIGETVMERFFGL